MKPINILRLLTSICLLSICISFQGCIDDDLSVCGINLRFTYTQNVDGVDKYNESVERISLFVFDTSDTFIGEYTQENTNNMNLNLMPGVYSLIAWGNLDESYTLSSFVPNETKLKDALLSLTRANDTITNYPTDLYHGALMNVEIQPDVQNNQSQTIDMIKNTKNISVTSVGLPITTRSSADDFICKITSINGDYNFDNSIAGDSRLHYIQDSEINENAHLKSKFVTMRELEDRSTDSRLIITHTEDSSTKEIFNESLVGLLLPATITGNLDIEDTFDILIEFTAGRITITVNGWLIKDSGRPV